MRSLGKIFLYCLFVLLGGALAAPQAWRLIHELPPDLLHGLVGEVQRMPFHRYLSRSIQVAAILLLVPLLFTLRVRSLEELGLYSSRRKLRDFLAGLAAGIPSVLLLILGLLFSGAFEIHFGWNPSVVPKFVVTAVVVAVLEEFLFRGVLLGFLRQSLSRWVAIVLSSLVFAGVHFLNLPSTGPASKEPSWWSGFASLASFQEGIPEWPLWAWTSATLLIAGILLGWMTTRTGSLWASIGLHGSWVFFQQLFNSMASYRHVPATAFLPSLGPSQCHGAVPIGLEPLVALLLAYAIAAVLLRSRPWPHLFTRLYR